jgi:hypothetical protein
MHKVCSQCKLVHQNVCTRRLTYVTSVFRTRQKRSQTEACFIIASSHTCLLLCNAFVSQFLVCVAVRRCASVVVVVHSCLTITSATNVNLILVSHKCSLLSNSAPITVFRGTRHHVCTKEHGQRAFRGKCYQSSTRTEPAGTLAQSLLS